jgi:hypothetical protein
LAPEAAASSALWTGLPASPATYTPGGLLGVRTAGLPDDSTQALV